MPEKSFSGIKDNFGNGYHTLSIAQKNFNWCNFFYFQKIFRGDEGYNEIKFGLLHPSKVFLMNKKEKFLEKEF